MKPSLCGTAVESDFASICRLYEVLHRDDDPAPDTTFMQARWRELIAFAGTRVFVAECRSDLVSSCTLVIVPNVTRGGRPYALIENVVTRADSPRRGYGRMVLERALDLAWTRGCYKVMLLSGEGNTSAHALYQSLGFDRSKIGFQITKP